MRVIAAALAMKVALAVATRARRFTRAVLRAKAFRACPGLQQSAVNREVLARQQALDFVLRQHGREELTRHLALQKPVAVLGETRGVSHRILDAEPDKPAKQQIGVDPLDQLALPPNSRDPRPGPRIFPVPILCLVAKFAPRHL